MIGIGPRRTLEKYSIPVVADRSSVGSNLQDQPTFSVSVPISLPAGQQLIRESESLTQLLQEAAGPLSSFNGLIAFEKIPQPFRGNFSRGCPKALDRVPTDWPEVEYLAATQAGPAGSNLGTIQAALAAPLSRGKVTISSSSIADPPIFDMGWYTDKNAAGIQVAVVAVRRIRQALKFLANITNGAESVPGLSVQTDEDIIAYIRNTTIPLYHAGGTCAMGNFNDSNAVVDGHARVIGVERLRVVDLSAVPFIPPGHPQATVYMLAEKIADDILKGLDG